MPAGTVPILGLSKSTPRKTSRQRPTRGQIQNPNQAPWCGIQLQSQNGEPAEHSHLNTILHVEVCSLWESHLVPVILSWGCGRGSGAACTWARGSQGAMPPAAPQASLLSNGMVVLVFLQGFGIYLTTSSESEAVGRRTVLKRF